MEALPQGRQRVGRTDHVTPFASGTAHATGEPYDALLTQLAGHLDCQLPPCKRLKQVMEYSLNVNETLTTKQLMIVELIDYYYYTIAYS